MGAARVPPVGRGRAPIALCSVIALTATVIGPAAAAPTGVPEQALDCVTSVEDEATAVATAQACGTEVEVEAARTAWDTVHALPDGTMRLDTSIAAVRTDVSGEWAEIDNALVEGPGGLEVASPVTGMVFSDGTPGQPLVRRTPGQPLVRMTRDGHELTFDVPFELTAPVVSGPWAMYPDVLPGVDLIVTVNDDATGFSEVLRVEDQEAAAAPELTALSLAVETSDGLDLGQLNGGFVARDGSGEEVFRSPAPAMWDSSGDVVARQERTTSGLSGLGRAVEAGVERFTALARAAGRLTAAAEGDVAVGMPTQVRGDEVTITPVGDVLTDPDTVWPVYIDPSITGTRAEWISVRDDGWADYNYTGDQGVGKCGTTGSPMYCSKVFTRRAMWEFNGLVDIGGMEPADIISATFRAYGVHSYSCTPAPVEAWRVGEISSATRWPGSWGVLQSTRNVAHKAACNNVGWIEFDVTEGARAVASVNASTLALGLKAADESSSAGWKRYQYDATLSIEYNRPPKAPTGARTTTPTSTCTQTTAQLINAATPTLRAVVTDPDGGNVQAHFEIFNGTTRVWNPSLTTAKSSGSEHTITVPAGTLSEGVTYQWRVNGQDPSGRTGPVVSCSVRVDVTPPAQPGVLPVTGQPAIYLENETSGAVGAVGKFQFTSGGSTDLARYRYSFNNDAYDLTAELDGNSQTSKSISFTPTALGPQVLYVRSEDKAGNSGTSRVYRFSVAFPGSSGVWLLDEGAGTTAVDSVVGGNLHPLTVSTGVSWVDGPRAELEIDPSDRALFFDGVADTAGSSGPVVATNASFSVSAIVRLDELGATASAVSQDGVNVSGFELGHRVDAACPTGTGTCWGFWMSPADSASPGAPTAALSGVPVQSDSWVQLTGVHNAGSDEIQLYVCDLGFEPLATEAVDFHASWNAIGGLQIGSGFASGARVHSWPGTVSSVRVYDGAIDEAEVYRTCQDGY